MPLLQPHRLVRAAARTALWVVSLYLAWLLLQVLHEAGHVLHALLSGGEGIRVVLPAVGFSRTDVAVNPHPMFVLCGGPLWGSLLPLIFWRVMPRRWSRTRMAAQAFAGLCLIGNGAYLGVGWVDRVGDAGDLVRAGVPAVALVAVGVPLVACGLWLWHRLDDSNRKRATTSER